MDSIVMFISILLLNILLLLIITVYYYHKQRSISKDLHTNANYLWSFRPIQETHNIFYIHQNQTRFILEDAIRQAKQSQRFTIVSKNRLLSINSMFLHIEMIQETRTIEAFIEYSHETERFSQYHYILRRFFMNIFHESKTIQIWGNIRQQMRSYTQYGYFHLMKFSKHNVWMFKKNSNYGIIVHFVIMLNVNNILNMITMMVYHAYVHIVHINQHRINGQLKEQLNIHLTSN